MDTDEDGDERPVRTARTKSRRFEFQPCQKDNGQLHEQRWVGTLKWNDQIYHRWVCRCDAAPKAHVNRLLHFSAHSVRYIRGDASVPLMHGRSIFGQTLQRK